MSTYTFRVVFSGLCGFVPVGKKDEELYPKRVDVLLAKTSSKESPESSSFSEYKELSPHLALLEFNTGDLVGVDNRITAKGLWQLNDEDVTFRLISVNGVDSRDLNRGISMKFDGRRLGSRQPFRDTNIKDPGARERDYKNQAADFSWLPEMVKVLREDKGLVAPGCFGNNPTNFVVARVSLEEGVLTSKDLGVYRGSPIIAQFVPAFEDDSEYAQALAHRTALEVEIDESFNVAVEVRKFQGDISCNLVLKPGSIYGSDGNPERGIEIAISNLCCGNAILDGSSSAEVTNTPAPSVDHDFSFMYTLLDGYEQLNKDFILPLPVPVVYEKDKTKTSQSGGIHGVECTGCRLPFYVLPDP